MKWTENAFRSSGITFYSAKELPDRFLSTRTTVRHGKTDLLRRIIFLENRYTASYLRVEKAIDTIDPEKLEYFPYQCAGIDYLTKVKKALLADEQGLGKTIQVIGMLNNVRPKRTLIICPASLKINWAEEIKTWGHFYFHNIDIVDGGKHAMKESATVRIVNYEMCHKLKDAIGKDYDQVILDEAHYLQNHEAKRTEAIIGPQGIARHTERVVAITGTPLSNRPIELWPMLASIFANYMPPEFLVRKKYAYHFCDAWEETIRIYDPKRRGVRYVKQLNCDGASNIKTLNYLLRERFMLRRKKSEVLPQLPKKVYSVVNIAAPRQVKTVLKQEENYREEVLRAIETGRRLPALEEMASVRQEIAVLKIPYTVEFVENLLKSEQKVILFVYHTAVARELQEIFQNKNYGVSMLIGSTPTKKRDKAVKDFQEGDNRIFIGNIVAAGTGLTLTAASNVVFVECSWVPGQNEQAVDRAHRISQTKQVNAYFLVWYGSMDAQILKSSIRKQKVINGVLK